VVEITRPAPIQIDAVEVKDIECFGGAGYITVRGAGGTGMLSPSYSVDGGVSFSPFSATTPLSAGVYHVGLHDENGCEIKDADNTYIITEPPAPLDFTYVQDEYNGYHVSCDGGDNGRIELTPSGGNGDGYGGYVFRLDDGTFASEY